MRGAPLRPPIVPATPGFTVVAMVALVGAAFAAGAACGPAQPPGPDPEMVAAGRQLFDRNGCANCHGSDGSGRGPNAAYMDPPPRDYRDPGSYRGGTDIDSIATAIGEGFVGTGGGMPAFAHLTEEQRRQIGAYVVSLQRPDATHVEVADAWVAASAAAATTAAAYLRVTARRSDAVLAVEARGARAAEIHRTLRAEGSMRMEAVDRLPLPADETVALQRGAEHLMLIDLDEPLSVGAEVDLTVFLESGTAVRLRVPVRAAAPQSATSTDRAPAAEEPLRTPPILQDFDLGGDFELVDHNGVAFDLAAHRGRTFLLFFGYTRCPDFCPATLSVLTQATARLGDRRDEVTTLFVSIDPDHDTAERLRSYLGAFDIDALGLTGTAQQLDAVVDAYAAVYEAADASEAGPLFGHSTYTYLLDGAGRVRYLFRPDDTPRFIAAGIEAALRH